MNVAALWDQLVDAVCRPPRDDALYDRKYYRQDVSLTNSRGQKLQASHYRPCVVTSADGRLPVVVYCHCNSGSRRDAEEILYHLLPKGITVFALDFSGSGLSEGSYVTLGALEVGDLAAAVQYLREEGSSSSIGLWGRSMGAVTALLYSQQDPSVAGMVLDSPFSRLVDLMLELATDQQLKIPKPLIKVALAMLKRSVKKRAGFSVDKVAPLDTVAASFIPALFAHGKDDSFVHPHHSERLFQAYGGDKNFVTFEGEHNSVRPDFFYDSALIFLLQALRVEQLVGPAELQALPPSQLPHLAPRGNSIYVTASRNLSEEDANGEGSRPASRASAGSPRSRSPSPGSPLSRASSSLSRQLNVPWALPRAGSARRGDLAAAVAGGQHAQHDQHDQHAVGQLAALLEGSGLEGAEAGAAAGYLGLSEEEALQRALEMSLHDARQQAQQQQAAATPEEAEAGVTRAQDQPGTQQQQPQQAADEAPAPAAAPAAEQAALHVRYNAAFAASRGEGQRNPLYGGTSGADMPATEDEEQAMLAAALAASLAEQQQSRAAAGAAAASGTGPTARNDAELAHYYGAAGAGAPAPAFGEPACEGQAPQQGRQQQGKLVGGTSGEGGPPVDEVPPAFTSSAAAQAVADAHAGQEAAAVRQPSLELAEALGAAAAEGGTLGLRWLVEGAGKPAAAALSASSSRALAAAAASAGGSAGNVPAGGAAAAVDPATGLKLSAPPPRELRDEVEEITIYQLEEMLAAGSGAAADPEIKRAAEETLEVLSVCESCSQELDQAGQWESFLSAAGLINSPQDYTTTPRPSGGERGAGGGGSAAAGSSSSSGGESATSG
ncbi:hypothetical protein ABPG75_009326 [Micractinium tetrahymenae]